MKEFIFRISRFKVGVIDPPEFYTYRIPVTEHMTVLDCLEKIRLEQDNTLLYRHSCHHSSCGTCAIRINGSEMLACTTKVWTLDEDTIALEPLRGFECVGDLAIKLDSFYDDIATDWAYLRPAEALGVDPSILIGRSFARFENCIECGSCVSACPVIHQHREFIGPAVLATLHREWLKSSRKKDAVIKRASGERGTRMCKRALACSRVCPTAVYPARHIAELASLTENKNSAEIDKPDDEN